MNSAATFPLPLAASLAIQRVRPGAAYIVVAMFTESYWEKARRLAMSCEKFRLSYAFYEVPAVHRSISSRGTPDPAFTKANFIHRMLSDYGRPVLYVDADCEFMAAPELLEGMANGGCDFAVYNWLADEHTDAFAPIDIDIGEGMGKKRFYAYSHSVDYFATDQLFCSGPVQFYANTEPARMLLAEWQRTILAFPGTADDACLDFAFNNLGSRGDTLRAGWLPKSYARYPWWIYVNPVINHADMPNLENEFVPIADPGGRMRFYPERTEQRNEVRLFTRDCIIDTQERLVCRMVGNRLVAYSRTDLNFWL